jgi:hypothetical protein
MVWLNSKADLDFRFITSTFFPLIQLMRFFLFCNLPKHLFRQQGVNRSVFLVTFRARVGLGLYILVSDFFNCLFSKNRDWALTEQVSPKPRPGRARAWTRPSPSYVLLLNNVPDSLVLLSLTSAEMLLTFCLPLPPPLPVGQVWTLY